MISKEREVRVYVNRSRGLLLARQTLKGFVWSSTNSTSLGVGKGKIRCPKGIYERVLRIFRSNRFAPIYNRVVGSIQCEKGWLCEVSRYLYSVPSAYQRSNDHPGDSSDNPK